MTQKPQPSAEDAVRAASRIAALNQLVMKAIHCETLKSLRFVILNDTISIIRYDRSVLWSFNRGRPKLEGISGQSRPNLSSELAQKWTRLMEKVKDPTTPQLLTEESFHGSEGAWDELHQHANVGVLWVPIKFHEDLVLGLWIERWHQEAAGLPPVDMLKMLTQALAPAYGATWNHLKQRGRLRRWVRDRKVLLSTISIFLFLSLFGIRIPLRVVAPSEIVAEDPYLITAPIEGILERLTVAPGDPVKKGDILFRYHPEEMEQRLQVAEKQVEMVQSALQRASVLGHGDEASLHELGMLRLRLQQEVFRTDLARYYFEQIEGKAPAEGVTIIDDPDRWRGRPVKVGEKIMTVADPLNSKVRLWLPESDNIALKIDQVIKIYLNVDPSKTYKARLTYVANRSTLNDEQLPSFVAEAEWLSEEYPQKLGLKGSSVVYGERVSLFYWLFRRPWTSLRNFLGV